MTNDGPIIPRQEIVKKEPAVQIMVERWPALFTETGKLFLFSTNKIMPIKKKFKVCA